MVRYAFALCAATSAVCRYHAGTEDAGRQEHQNDRAGLEQLARYGLRPALSLERLREAGDGTYLYEMKRRFSDGSSRCVSRRASCCCGYARWCCPSRSFTA